MALRARWRILRRYVAWRDLLRAAGWLALPPALVLILLAVTGATGAGPALLGAVAAYAGIAAVLTPHFRDLKRVRDYVEGLRARDEPHANLPDPPRIDSPGLDRRVPEAILESTRARESHRRELDAAIRGNAVVLSNLPDPLLLLDSQGDVRRANRAAGRLFGSALTERPLANVIRNPDLLQAADAVVAGDPQKEGDSPRRATSSACSAPAWRRWWSPRRTARSR